MVTKNRAVTPNYEQVRAAKKELATKKVDELNALTSTELKKLCQSIDLVQVKAILDTHGASTDTYKKIVDGADFIPVSIASKPEMVQSIVDATTDERRLIELEERIKVIPPDLTNEALESMGQKAGYLDEISQSDIGNIAKTTWIKLREYILTLWDSEKQVWLPTDGGLVDLINSFSTSIIYRKNLQGEVIAASTALNYKTTILKQIKEMMELETTNPHYQTFVDVFNSFERNVHKAFATLHTNKNRVYQEDLDKRQRDVQTIKVYEFVDWARRTLSNLTPDTSKTQWKEVYIALGVLTGRRKGELTSTASFQAVGENTVNFAGQLKTKGREDAPDSYNIPVLCPAYDVIKAMDWLEQKGKREPDQHKAHQKYAKDLNKGIKDILSGCIRIVTPEGIQSGENLNDKTFHACRKIYAEICSDILRPSNMTIRKYISTILGHSDRDNTTATSYDADFDVIDAHEI